MHRRPFALTGGHSTRAEALAAWDEAGAGRNTHVVTARYRRRWYAFDREEFETEERSAAHQRLELYMEGLGDVVHTPRSDTRR